MLTKEYQKMSLVDDDDDSDADLCSTFKSV